MDAYIGIDASQINSATANHDWGVKRDEAMVDKLEALNELLIQCHLEPMSSKSFTRTI